MEEMPQIYLDWLAETHAMHEQSLRAMQGLVGRLEQEPILRARIEAHIGDTRAQQDTLLRLLRVHGARPAASAGMASALAQASAGLFVQDAVVQAIHATYTFAALKIASVRILITMADQLGDAEAVEALVRCLDQEEAMADWLSGHSAGITRSVLCRTVTNHAVGG